MAVFLCLLRMWNNMHSAFLLSARKRLQRDHADGKLVIADSWLYHIREDWCACKPQLPQKLAATRSQFPGTARSHVGKNSSHCEEPGVGTIYVIIREARAVSALRAFLYVLVLKARGNLRESALLHLSIPWYVLLISQQGIKKENRYERRDVRNLTRDARRERGQTARGMAIHGHSRAPGII